MCGSILVPGLIMPFDPSKFLSSKEIQVFLPLENSSIELGWVSG